MTRLGKNDIIKMWIAVFGCWLLQQLLLVLSLPKNYSNYSIITLHSDSMGNSFDLVTFQTHIKLQMSQCVIGKRRQKYAKLFFAKPVKSKFTPTVIITIKPTNFLSKFHRMIGYMKLELKFFINERNVLAECFKNKTNSAITIGGFIAAISVESPAPFIFISIRGSNSLCNNKCFLNFFNLKCLQSPHFFKKIHTLCNFKIHKNKSDTFKL